MAQTRFSQKAIVGSRTSMISQTVKKCSVCQRGYPLSAVFCPFDGASLVETASTDPGLVTETMTQPMEPVPPLPAVDPLVGRTIERYQIIKEIGHGGMGSVYRAVHTQLNRAFAIKVMRRDLGSDPVAVRRFRREALALGALTHPNAVNVTDFGVTETGLPFLVMEYLEGVDLRNLIVREAPLRLQRVATILSQICGAVSAAHRVGIVHRDLKPENIMLVESEDGEVAKVLDFGIARLASSELVTGRLTARDIIIGTPNYMSPEACQGLEQTAASDIYSLGVILFEMITGRFLYESDVKLSALEIAARHVKEMPPTPSSRNPELSPEIDAVVLRALSKDPELRQASAHDLAREFEAAVAQLRPASTDTDSLSRDTAYTSASATVRDLRANDTQASTDASTVATPSPPRYGAMFAALAVAALLVVGAATVAVVGIQRGWFRTAAPEAPIATPPEKAPDVGAAVPDGMVLVPAGSFMMGEPEDAVDRDPREPPNWPPHRVDVGAFYLDVREVTNGDYERFVRATGAPEPEGWAGAKPANWANIPVSGVTWVDADNYARWAGKRLPTEEEWEYAARGTDGRAYPWGTAWDASKSVVERPAADGPEPAGSHADAASPFGVLDLAGSLWEWTSSNFTVYPGGPDVSPDLLTRKVIRGGSYASTAGSQRSTVRAVQPPYARERLIGFRCAKSVGA